MRLRVGIQSQPRHRQIGQRGAGLALWRNGRARSALGVNLRRRPALGPVTATCGTDAGGGRLLVYGIAAAVDQHVPAPGITRQRPGRAGGVGYACKYGESQRRTPLLHRVDQTLLPPKKMRAACNVEHKRRRRFLGHPRRKPHGPTAQGRQERGLGLDILQSCHQPRTKCLCVAMRLAHMHAFAGGLFRQGRDHLHLSGFAQYRQGLLPQGLILTDQAFGPQTREPEGKDTTI